VACLLQRVSLPSQEINQIHRRRCTSSGKPLCRMIKGCCGLLVATCVTSKSRDQPNTSQALHLKREAIVPHDQSVFQADAVIRAQMESLGKHGPVNK